MKITKEKFLAALSVGARVAQPKATLPVLACVMIEARKAVQRVFLTSTNLDMCISTSTPAVIEKDFSVCLPGSRFTGIVGALAEGEITITVTDRFAISMKCGPSDYRFMGMSGAEFPIRPPIASGVMMELKQQDLADRLNSVAASASDQEQRYIIKSVLVAKTPTGITFVATDGRRMHVNTSNEASDGQLSIIIPDTAVDKLVRLLEGTGKVQVTLDDKQVEFVIDRPDGEIVFQTKVVAGNYPNWRGVLAQYETKGVMVDREGLRKAVKLVALATTEKFSAICLEFKEQKILLTAGDEDTSQDELDCANPHNLSGKVAVNYRFLLDAVNAGTDETTVLNIKEVKPEMSPLAVNCGDLQTMVMPVRLK
jgi:DNA polymerase-3 subunit beta